MLQNPPGEPVTRTKSFSLSTFAYVLLTFPLAYVWHLVAFRSFYERVGYFGAEEPIVALGFLTIVAQGLLLAYAYPFFQTGGRPIVEGLRFAAIFGAFLITCQVVAAAAKRQAPPTAEWFLFESFYLALQFAMVGVAFAFIHRKNRQVAHAP